MRRGTVRRPGKKGAGGTLKKQMIVMAAMLAILAFEAVYLAYQSSNRLASSVSDVWQGMLETQSEHVRNSLFMKNPYLTPDTLYLAKLKAAFYDDPDMVVETSREAGCDPGHVSLAISNLCSNIKMGITYSNSLRSCYWMLEDPDAPYVLINGNPTIKAEVTDAEWMDVCREMEQDVRVLPEQHVGTDRLSAHSLGKLPPGRDDHGLLGAQLRSVKHAQRLHGTNVRSGVRLPVRYTA